MEASQPTGGDGGGAGPTEPHSPPTRAVGDAGGDKRANEPKYPKVGGDEGVFLPWPPTKKDGSGDGGTDGGAVDSPSLTSGAGGSGGGGDGGGSGASEAYSVVPASSGRGVRRPLCLLTTELLQTYQRLNPDFRILNVVPRRMLTQPAEPVLNNGADNSEANLICRVHDVLTPEKSKSGLPRSYAVLDLLGQGTFGQVFRCQIEETKEMVAVKIIKNKPAYTNQAWVEVRIASLLNRKHDPQNQGHLVRLHDFFEYKGHLCLVFEVLNINLYELLKQNQFRGLPLPVVKPIVRQLLEALAVLQKASVVHCDLKPENVLLVPPDRATDNSINPPAAANKGSSSSPSAAEYEIKVIDFGSACFEDSGTMHTYIQSRFYRSPEVLLGLPYDGAIDVWSLGCICAEMFLGLPLFPGVSEHNQLSRIVDMLGPPPDLMMDLGKEAHKFYVKLQEPTPLSGATKFVDTAKPGMGGEKGEKKIGLLAATLATKPSPDDDKAAVATVDAASEPALSMKPSLSYNQLFGSPDGDSDKADAQDASTVSTATTAGATESKGGVNATQGAARGGAGAAASTSTSEKIVKQTKHRLKTAKEYAADTGTEVPVSKKYFKHRLLRDIINSAPMRRGLKGAELEAEKDQRRAFVHLIHSLLRYLALQHPFLTGERLPDNGRWKPPPDMKTTDRAMALVRESKKYHQEQQRKSSSYSSSRAKSPHSPTTLSVSKEEDEGGSNKEDPTEPTGTAVLAGKGEPRSGSTEPVDAVTVESAAPALASSTSSNELSSADTSRRSDAEGGAAPTMVQSGLGRSLAESTSSADDDHAVAELGTNANSVPSDGTGTSGLGGGIGGAVEGGPLPGGIPGGAPGGTLIVDKDGMPTMTHYTPPANSGWGGPIGYGPQAQGANSATGSMGVGTGVGVGVPHQQRGGRRRQQQYGSPYRGHQGSSQDRRRGSGSHMSSSVPHLPHGALATSPGSAGGFADGYAGGYMMGGGMPIPGGAAGAFGAPEVYYGGHQASPSEAAAIHVMGPNGMPIGGMSMSQSHQHAYSYTVASQFGSHTAGTDFAYAIQRPQHVGHNLATPPTGGNIGLGGPGGPGGPGSGGGGGPGSGGGGGGGFSGIPIPGSGMMMGSPQGFGISPSAGGMYSPGGPGSGMPPSADSHSNNPTTGASWAPSGGWLSQSPHGGGGGGGGGGSGYRGAGPYGQQSPHRGSYGQGGGQGYRGRARSGDVGGGDPAGLGVSASPARRGGGGSSGGASGGGGGGGGGGSGARGAKKKGGKPQRSGLAAALAPREARDQRGSKSPGSGGGGDSPTEGRGGGSQRTGLGAALNVVSSPDRSSLDGDRTEDWDGAGPGGQDWEMEGVGTGGGGGGGIGASLAMGQPPMGMPPHQGGMMPQYHQGGMMPMPGYQMGTSPHQYGGGMMPPPGYQMGTSPHQYHQTGGGMMPPPGYQMGSSGPPGYGKSKGRNPPTHPTQ